MAFAQDIGTGVSVAQTTGSFDSGTEFEVLNLSVSGITREAIETSHMGTTSYKSFVPADLTDPGTLELEIAFDADFPAPVTAAADTVTITFPQHSSEASTAAKFAASMFVTDFSFSVPFEDRQTASVSLKLTGAPTWTAST